MAGGVPPAPFVDMASRHEPAPPRLEQHPETPKAPHGSHSLQHSSTERKESTAAERLRALHAQATAKLHEKLHASDSTKRDSEGSKSMQDRLMYLLLHQIIPTDAGNGAEEADRQSRKRPGAERPNFSLPTMSSNFRRFNARIGVAFVFQNQLIDLFSWQKPTQTVSFLAIYTFTCIEPTMLAIMPLAMTLYFIMFPSFIARHPPPPSLPATNLYPLTGPPLAPAAKIKPAPELSKDFFHNMRDIQNSMDDFSRLHDLAIANIGPLTNFSDESVSSAIFIALFTACLLLFLTTHLFPWRTLFLLAGYAAVLSGHPRAQALLEAALPRAAGPHNALLSDCADAAADAAAALEPSHLRRLAKADVVLDPERERREVEMFELQFRRVRDDSDDDDDGDAAAAAKEPKHNAFAENAGWQHAVFAPAPHTPLSPARIAGQKPRGARAFEDVAPPAGWRWADKKWVLDLLATEWVADRCITGVDVEVEGGRWVVDSHAVREEGRGGAGEWRRRRWVRVVERVAVGMNDD